MRSPSRERIKGAALHLFAEHGYTGTPTSEICRRARVTKPVLYYHFRSKENLYRILLSEAHADDWQTLVAASRHSSAPLDRLTDVMAADFACTKRRPDVARLLFRVIFSPSKEVPAFDYVGVGLQWVGLLEEILQQGVRRKELTCDPRHVAEAALGVHMLYSMSFLLRGEPDLNRRLARRIAKLLLQGCTRNSTDR